MNSPKQPPGKLSKAEIKLITALQHKKYREIHGLFVIEGEKLVKEAQNSDLEIIKIVYRDEIGEKLMGRLSFLSSPSPVLALVKKPKTHLDEFFAPKDSKIEGPPNESLYLGLDRISDPGNLGTIIRIAEWFGVRGVFLGPGTADPYNPKVVQGAMGSLFRMPIVQVDLSDVLKWAKSQGVSSYGAVLGGQNINECSLNRGGLVIVGNESKGLSKELASQVDHLVTIPNFDFSSSVDSLNVAAATAIICWEFRRGPNQN